MEKSTICAADGGQTLKQWCLTKHKTVNSFENWRQNFTYTLSLDSDFAPSLLAGAGWESPCCEFKDDADTVPGAQRRTKKHKAAMLELMLGQIAKYCLVISWAHPGASHR